MPAFEPSSAAPCACTSTRRDCWITGFIMPLPALLEHSHAAWGFLLPCKASLKSPTAFPGCRSVTRASPELCLVAVLQEAKSWAVQVSQEGRQAALIIPGDCITSPLFWLGFLFPTFNLNRCRQSVAFKQYFVTLSYREEAPGFISVWAYQPQRSPSWICSLESVAFYSFNWPACFLWERFLTIWGLVRIPRNCAGICTPQVQHREEGHRGTRVCQTPSRPAQTPAARSVVAFQSTLLLYFGAWNSYIEHKIQNKPFCCPTAISEIKDTLR